MQRRRRRSRPLAKVNPKPETSAVAVPAAGEPVPASPRKSRRLRLPSPARYAVVFAILTAVTCCSFRWTFDQNHYFFADTWTHLWFAAFGGGPISDLTAVLRAPWPYARPVGGLLVAVLYTLFGLNPLPFHIVLFCLHLLNVFLVLHIATRFFDSLSLGAATAFLFGNYHIAAMAAVTWTGAIFDLACNSLLLLALVSYLSSRRIGWILSIVCYLLALRAKQMALPFPLILLLWEVCQGGIPMARPALLRIIRRLWPHLLLMLFAGASGAYITLFSSAKLNPENSYQMTFTVRTFAEGLYYYLKKLFYLDNLPAVPALLVFAIGLLAAIWFRRPLVVFGGVAFVISLLPVIFVTQHRSTIYLYVPVVFFSILVVAACNWLFGAVFSAARFREHAGRDVMVAALTVLVAAVLVARGTALGTNYLHSVAVFDTNLGRMNRAAIAFMQSRFPNLRPGTAIFVAGVPEYSNVFDYNGGLAIQVLYRDKTIKVTTGKSEDELDERFRAAPNPRFFLKYAEGKYTDITALIRKATTEAAPHEKTVRQ